MIYCFGRRRGGEEELDKISSHKITTARRSHAERKRLNFNPNPTHVLTLSHILTLTLRETTNNQTINQSNKQTDRGRRLSSSTEKESLFI
jgi:hypothetical protein